MSWERGDRVRVLSDNRFHGSEGWIIEFEDGRWVKLRLTTGPIIRALLLDLIPADAPFPPPGKPPVIDLQKIAEATWESQAQGRDAVRWEHLDEAIKSEYLEMAAVALTTIQDQREAAKADLKLLLVRMPEASAPDVFAVAAEVSGSVSEIADVDLVIGLWPNKETVVAKWREGDLSAVEVRVVDGVSVR